jgi:hypothetical protein
MRLTLVAGATIALLGSVAAQAADLPLAPPPSPVVAPPIVDPITAFFQLIFTAPQPVPPPPPPVVRKY